MVVVSQQARAPGCADLKDFLACPMEITRGEFAKALPGILANLEACDFCTVDAEFTGFTTESAQSSHFDSLDDRYAKHRTTAQTYQICQLGLCPFIYHPDTGEYTAHPYNFYVFPRRGATSNDPIGATFAVQATSLEFLRQQNFDLNRWVWHGIGYMTREEEGNRERTQVLADIHVDPPGQAFLDRAHQSIQDWLHHAPGAPTEKYLNLTTSNGYQKRLVFQHVRQRYPDVLDATGMHGFVQIRRKGPGKDKKKIKQEQCKKLYQEWMVKDVGLRSLLDVLVASKKPLVGHNMILDILFIHNTFHSSRPLPSHRSDFIREFHSLHPILFDTKWLAEEADIPWTMGLEDTSIQTLMTTSPRSTISSVQLAPGFDLYQGREKMHEAGYDAYATGLIFLDLIQPLLSSSPFPLFPVNQGYVQIPRPLQAHLNHLYMIKLGSIPFFLGSDEKFKEMEAQIPRREEKENVLLLTLPPGSRIDLRAIQWAISDLGPGVTIQAAGEDRWWVAPVNHSGSGVLTVERLQEVVARDGTLPVYVFKEDLWGTVLATLPPVKREMSSASPSH
ncbi:ribonuclease H-like domain-containing protein [Piptocephalis cylindrospora]|uniref:Ribonuclease H-like domain-containing protein n=1 Tax=Piptocephalis cylindrospora TaxID=1907219 RepID=A0A4P9Y3C5_9FUNG|nr:ribonuclease H-like domain-containing protein [Piptocephalis cylindrospora]|eukprot:RKP13132.1 ribonuclease H-like domain-containing protein [Piptocephalis cylindrospora]